MSESVLARSVKLRMPRFTEEDTGRERVGRLQDHILETAIMRGELAELRLQAHTDLLGWMKEWNAMRGWEQYKRSGDKTQTANEAAKRRHSPELAEKIDTAKWTIQRCTEEMDRLGGSDYDAASRAYTLLTG